MNKAYSDICLYHGYHIDGMALVHAVPFYVYLNVHCTSKVLSVLENVL